MYPPPNKDSLCIRNKDWLWYIFYEDKAVTFRWTFEDAFKELHWIRTGDWRLT